MSDHDQILAMAQLHGLTDISSYGGSLWADATVPFLGCWLTDRASLIKSTPARYHGRVPDYLRCLDAVAEVEALIIRAFRDEHLYVGMLSQIAAPRNSVWSPLRALACASARDRVEALLRLKGLWTGDDSP